MGCDRVRPGATGATGCDPVRPGAKVVFVNKNLSVTKAGLDPSAIHPSEVYARAAQQLDSSVETDELTVRRFLTARRAGTSPDAPSKHRVSSHRVAQLDDYLRNAPICEVAVSTANVILSELLLVDVGSYGFSLVPVLDRERMRNVNTE